MKYSISFYLRRKLPPIHLKICLIYIQCRPRIGYFEFEFLSLLRLNRSNITMKYWHFYKNLVSSKLYFIRDSRTSLKTCNIKMIQAKTCLYGIQEKEPIKYSVLIKRLPPIHRRSEVNKTATERFGRHLSNLKLLKLSIIIKGLFPHEYETIYMVH